VAARAALIRALALTVILVVGVPPAGAAAEDRGGQPADRDGCWTGCVVDADGTATWDSARLRLDEELGLVVEGAADDLLVHGSQLFPGAGLDGANLFELIEAEGVDHLPLR